MSEIRNPELAELFAPQRVFASQDDGATWQALPTPGVGARRLLVDANGDLVIEGLEASAVLRTGPLRLDRMAGAPRPITLDTKSSGTSGRNSRSDFGWRTWRQMIFCALVPSWKGLLPVSK